jgi:hypothetical protein
MITSRAVADAALGPARSRETDEGFGIATRSQKHNTALPFQDCGMMARLLTADRRPPWPEMIVVKCPLEY